MGRESGRTVWRGIDDQDRCGSATDARGTAASARRVYVQYVDRGQERGSHRASRAVRASVQPRVQGCIRRVAGDSTVCEPGRAAGPSFMPEYFNTQIEKGLELNERGDRVFDEGTCRTRARRRLHPADGRARDGPVHARAVTAVEGLADPSRRPRRGRWIDDLRPGCDRNLSAAVAA